MKHFAGIDQHYAQFDRSAVLLQPIIYDGTSTWGKGADQGFAAFLEAAENMELFDIETQSEVYRKGIHMLPPLDGFQSPEQMFGVVYAKCQELLHSSKFLTFFGGEHSISIGIIKAFYEHFDNLSILQIDAHADLRPSYQGSRFNHACALHDASQNTNLVQVGIRSMDVDEEAYLDVDKCFFMHDIWNNSSYQEQVLEKLSDRVYITLDLDALDPGIMPSTGTPEPGGFQWFDILVLLQKIFANREIVGFDIVELSPIPHLHAPNFLVAKLYYKMLTYKFHL